MTKKHGRFYYDLITFEIEDTIHKVPRYGFERWSQSLFRDMFSLPQGENVEGRNDENPIRPPECTNLEFESLMHVMYPRDLSGSDTVSMSKDEWVAVLKISKQWDMPEISALAVKALNKTNLLDFEKIALGRRFKNEQWIVEGCTNLSKTAYETPLKEMGEALGWETAARILWVAGQPSCRVPSEAVTLRGSHLSCVRCNRQLQGPSPEQTFYCGICRVWDATVKVPVPCSAFMQGGIQKVNEKVREIFEDDIKECQERGSSEFRPWLSTLGYLTLEAPWAPLLVGTAHSFPNRGSKVDRNFEHNVPNVGICFDQRQYQYGYHDGDDSHDGERQRGKLPQRLSEGSNLTLTLPSAGPDRLEETEERATEVGTGKPMRHLTLHASALNNDEYEEYTKSLKELADIGDSSQDEADGDDYFERQMLGVREVRAWMRGRYEGLGASTIDSILKFFSPSLGVGDTLTGGQFLAALRLITHVQHGKALDRALAFVQAHPQLSPRTMPPAPPRRSQPTSEHPQPPQHPSKHPHPHTHQGHPQAPAPQPENHNTTNPFLATTTNAGPSAPTPPIGIKPRPKPPRSEDGGGGLVGYGYIGGGGAGLSTSPSKAGPPLPPRKPVRAGSPTKAAMYPYGPAKGGAGAGGGGCGDGGTVFVSIATSSSSGSAPPPPPPPRPRPQSMQVYPAAPQGPISLHSFKGAPVHAIKVSTPSLIDKSLQASRVAQEAKRVEDMREKERVMQVLKRSGPVEAGGRSGPFKPPKPLKMRLASSNPYPKAMPTSPSLSGSSNDREGQGHGVYRHHSISTGSGSYGAFVSGADHEWVSGGARHQIYGTQQPSPPVSTSSLEQVALAVADSDVEDEAGGGLERKERNFQGRSDEGGRSGGYFGRRNDRSVGRSEHGGVGERDDEGRKGGYFGRHDENSVRSAGGRRGGDGIDDGSSRSSRSSHRGLPPRAPPLGYGAGAFVDSPSSSPGRGVVELPSTSGIDPGTPAAMASKKPPPPPPPPTHPDRKPVGGKSRSRASSRGTSLAGGRSGDNGEDERGEGPASAASAFDAVYARLESPMGSPSPFNAAWSAKFGGDAAAGNFGEHGRGPQGNPFDSPVAPPSAFGGAGFGSRSAGHSRAGSGGQSRPGSLGGRSGSASPLNSNPGSPSIPFGGGLGGGQGTIGRVLRSKSLHYAGGEKPGPFSANYSPAPTLGPFGRLPWERPRDSREDEGLLGNDVSVDSDEGERDGLRGNRRTRGHERGVSDAVDRNRDGKGGKGTGSTGRSRERSYGKGFGFGPPPQHHSHAQNSSVDFSAPPFSNSPAFSGGGSGVGSPFGGASSGVVSGLSRHTSLGGGGGSGHRKSSLSVSSLPQQRHPVHGQQAQGQERDKGPFRMHSTSDHSSDPRYRTRGLEVPSKGGTFDGLGGKPPPPDPASKPKLQDSFGKTRAPNSASSKPLQSISRLNEKLAGTFEAKIQPKLEQAKFKAEAGLSRRGFVPGATATGGFHSHTASSYGGREKEGLMSEYDGGGFVSDDDRDGVDGCATANFGRAGGAGAGAGERKLGGGGGGVYSSDSDDQSVFEVGGSQTRINADGAPEGGWKALR